MIKSFVMQKRAIALRGNQTEAEQIIWNIVRRHQLGFKFKRQQKIDHYIVDFICFEKRIIIEIDGGQHSQEKDAVRTAYLERSGFTVLRFWNNEVMQNKEGVFQIIQHALA